MWQQWVGHHTHWDDGGFTDVVRKIIEMGNDLILVWEYDDNHNLFPERFEGTAGLAWLETELKLLAAGAGN